MRALLTFVLLAGCSTDLVDRMEAEKQKQEQMERALEARKIADQAMRDSEAANERVAKLQADLDAFDKRLNEAVETISSAQTQADRDAAKAKLDALRREKAELEARVSQAKAEAAKTQRRRGVRVSEECKANPLAKGCN